MYKCPIDYFTDNLVFNSDKSCWAIYKLSGYDFDFLSDEGKISMLHKLARVLSNIMSEAQILIVPTEQNIKEHFKGLKGKLKKEDVLCDAAIQQADKTEKYLEDTIKLNGAINDYLTYFVIKLDENTDYEVITRLKDAYQYFVKSPVNAMNVFMNLDTKDILESKIEQYIKLAEKWFFAQNKRIHMEQIDIMETQWLIRRGAFRAAKTPQKEFYGDNKKASWKPKSDKIDVDKETIIKPLKRDIVNLFSGRIIPKNRYLKVETDGNVSYQSFLVITNIPDVIDYPGCEWIYMLQEYNTQAEICIHIKVKEYRQGIKQLEKQKLEINSQMEHISGAYSEVPDDLLEGKDYADMMEAEIKNSRSPILQTTVKICIAASSRDEMEKKVTTVKNAYEDMNFIIERPVADQVNLYMQFIPSVGTIIKDFVMQITPLTLASGVIGATHALGDSVGPYIGTTGIEKKHVFLEMGLACLLNKSASATFFGNLGVGKSFNADLLLYLNVLYGGFGLVFDPKGERSHWIDTMKVFNGLITLVTLSSEERYKGKLDPYNVYKDDLSLANELAINVLSELFKIVPTSDEYTAILEAIRRIEEGDMLPSMLKIAFLLENFDKSDNLHDRAKMLARRIKLQKENGMGQLLIGDGTEEAISLENRLNILQIQNLKLPGPETPKQDYTSEENLSTVLMMVLSHFAKKFALVKRPVFSIILFDESWALGKTAEGVKLFDYLSRMGRSLYTGCIFNGHSVLDIPTEGIKNTISYKFCFQTTNDNEAKRMLEYMGLEDTQNNREELKNLGNAECLFQDLSGHVGKLKFDAVFQDIIEIFKTTPKTEEDTNEDISTAPEGTEEKAEGVIVKVPEETITNIGIYEYEEVI